MISSKSSLVVSAAAGSSKVGTPAQDTNAVSLKAPASFDWLARGKLRSGIPRQDTHKELGRSGLPEAGQSLGASSHHQPKERGPTSGALVASGGTPWSIPRWSRARIRLTKPQVCRVGVPLPIAYARVIRFRRFGLLKCGYCFAVKLVHQPVLGTRRMIERDYDVLMCGS
ncbi:hypothetical protein BD779DRAFT_624755 [Infundibulicybe gibba]|nr:hypothetical protein BD779DRAFT_624755 [Infundibulicybe gibba]